MELKDAQVVFKNGRPDYLLINNEVVDRYRLLAIASNSDDKEFAWKILNLASRLFHWQDDKTFNTLYGAVATEITIYNKEDEFTIHQKFNQQVKELFGENAVVVKRINDLRHQPDSWVNTGGTDIPVEMKKRSFDGKALKQLLRYMTFYNCEFGIAVGEKCTVDLPKNITFISTHELSRK